MNHREDLSLEIFDRTRVQEEANYSVECLFQEFTTDRWLPAGFPPVVQHVTDSQCWWFP